MYNIEAVRVSPVLTYIFHHYPRIQMRVCFYICRLCKQPVDWHENVRTWPAELPRMQLPSAAGAQKGPLAGGDSACQNGRLSSQDGCQDTHSIKLLFVALELERDADNQGKNNAAPG